MDEKFANQFTEIDSVESFIQRSLDYMKDFAANGGLGYSFPVIVVFSLAVVAILFFVHGNVGNRIVAKLLDAVLVYFALVLFFAYVAGSFYYGGTTFAQYKLGGWVGFIGIFLYWVTFQILITVKAMLNSRADKKRAVKRFRNMQDRDNF